MRKGFLCYVVVTMPDYEWDIQECPQNMVKEIQDGSHNGVIDVPLVFYAYFKFKKAEFHLYQQSHHLDFLTTLWGHLWESYSFHLWLENPSA